MTESVQQEAMGFQGLKNDLTKYVESVMDLLQDSDVPERDELLQDAQELLAEIEGLKD